LKLVWLESALEDQDAILDYIADRNETAAERLYAAIQACTERILEYPFMYETGRARGTREALVHPNYILIYRVTGDVVQVLALIHARQQYP
jgi:addiction module RelE/StbE family toxin